MSIIRNIIWKLSWRKRLCTGYLYLKSVSNHNPCYECKLGSEYERK